MTFSNAVTRFRQDFLAEFTDVCDIVRPTTTRGAINPATYQYDAEADTTLYTDLPCLARPAYSPGGAPVEVGETVRNLHLYRVHVEWDTDGLRPDDIVTLTTVTTVDADLVGLPLVLRRVTSDSFNARRVLYCEANLGPGKQV